MKINNKMIVECVRQFLSSSSRALDELEYSREINLDEINMNHTYYEIMSSPKLLKMFKTWLIKYMKLN